MPEPIKASDAELRRWRRNLAGQVPPDADPLPADVVAYRARLLQALRADLAEATADADAAQTPAVRAYLTGKIGGLHRAIERIEEAPDA